MMDTPRIAMIAAVAENNVIGRGDELPWRIPSDMAHFKRTTMGKPVIMGRRQFEIFGRPLPGRVNIVVTRKTGYQPDGVIVINDLEAALSHAREMAAADGQEEAVVVGGGDIYRQAMALADRLYITHVAARPEGDTYFPDIDPGVWDLTEQVDSDASPKDEHAYTIAVYERRDPRAH